MPKKAKVRLATPEQFKALVAREEEISSIASSCAELAGRINEAERRYKLPRSDFDDQLREIEEAMREIIDDITAKGIELCGGDIEEWLEVCETQKQAKQVNK